MILRAGTFNKTTFWILSSPFILLALSGLLSENAEARQRNNVAFASVALLKSHLANRAGFQVETMRVTDTGAACIQFYTRDPAGTTHDQAVVVDGRVAQSSVHDGKFEKAWDRQCSGPAYDVTDAVDLFF